MKEETFQILCFWAAANSATIFPLLKTQILPSCHSRPLALVPHHGVWNHCETKTQCSYTAISHPHNSKIPLVPCRALLHPDVLLKQTIQLQGVFQTHWTEMSLMFNQVVKVTFNHSGCQLWRRHEVWRYQSCVFFFAFQAPRLNFVQPSHHICPCLPSHKHSFFRVGFESAWMMYAIACWPELANFALLYHLMLNKK